MKRHNNVSLPIKSNAVFKTWADKKAKELIGQL